MFLKNIFFECFQYAAYKTFIVHFYIHLCFCYFSGAYLINKMFHNFLQYIFRYWKLKIIVLLFFCSASLRSAVNLVILQNVLPDFDMAVPLTFFAQRPFYLFKMKCKNQSRQKDITWFVFLCGWIDSGNILTGNKSSVWIHENRTKALPLHFFLIMVNSDNL